MKQQNYPARPRTPASKDTPHPGSILVPTDFKKEPLSLAEKVENGSGAGKSVLLAIGAFLVMVVISVVALRSFGAACAFEREAKFKVVYRRINPDRPWPVTIDILLEGRIPKGRQYTLELHRAGSGEKQYVGGVGEQDTRSGEWWGSAWINGPYEYKLMMYEPGSGKWGGRLVKSFSIPPP